MDFCSVAKNVQGVGDEEVEGGRQKPFGNWTIQHLSPRKPQVWERAGGTVPWATKTGNPNLSEGKKDKAAINTI